MIPKFEEEVVAAGARRYGGDAEKVPTTRIKALVDIEHGTRIESRYRKAHEFDTMVRFLEGLPDDVQERIQRIFCDSKAGSAYEVELLRGMDILDWKFTTALLRCAFDVIGHNGVLIQESGGERSVFVDPHWPGDEE